MDYSLSAMAAAGVRTVILLAPGGCSTLLSHVGSGRTWGLQQRPGGLRVLQAEPGLGTFPLHALRSAIPYLEQADGVLLSHCSLVSMPDMGDLTAALDGADAALYYAPQVQQPLFGDAIRLEHGHFAAFERCFLCQQDLFLGCLAIRKEALISIVRRASGATDLTELIDTKLRVRPIPHTGYVGAVSTPQGYLQCSHDLLLPEVRAELFRPVGGVLRPHENCPPTRYPDGAVALRSLVGGGCHIAGTIRDSILFPGVQVGCGAQVDGSVLLPGCKIGAGCSLRYAVCGENVTLSPGLALSGQPEYPFLLGKSQLQ